MYRTHTCGELRLKDVNLQKRMIIPNNRKGTFRGTKNTFVTFINSNSNDSIGQLIIFGYSIDDKKKGLIF